MKNKGAGLIFRSILRGFRPSDWPRMLLAGRQIGSRGFVFARSWVGVRVAPGFARAQSAPAR